MRLPTTHLINLIGKVFMRKTKLLLALMAAFAAHSVSGQTKVVVVHVDGGASTTFELADIKWFTFGEGNLGITGKEEASPTFSIPLGNVRVIKLVDGSSSIGENVLADNVVEISYRSGMLTATGIANPVKAVIYGADGRAVYSENSWEGGSISTASLPGGVYIFKVNNQSFKFAK